MTSTLEMIPGLPIIVVAVEQGGNILQEIDDILAQVIETIAAQPRPVYLVLDLSGVLLRLGQVSLLVDRLARGDEALLRHPNLRETAVVVAGDVVTTALKIVNGGLFDGVRLSTWATREAALAHCRAQAGDDVW